MIFVKPLTAPHGKESAINAGDLGSIPGLGRSPGGGNGNPLQYSCLENPMDGGAYLQATVHRVTKSWTRLNARHRAGLEQCGHGQTFVELIDLWMI